jgi:beta-phosphoglucomutase-like phosphatase (HAD superfamily)
MKYDFYVFDCDGVILQSNAIKSDAYLTVLQNEPVDMLRTFVEYEQDNAGVSRYVKFNHYFRNIRGHAEPGAAVASALQQYTAIVSGALEVCPLVDGVQDFLNTLDAAKKPCAVNSGSDEKELRCVFNARGLERYFQHILGSPDTKDGNMKRLADAGFMKGAGVMFGDARADFEAATAQGLDFVFVTDRSNWKEGAEVCLKAGARVVKNFTGMKV